MKAATAIAALSSIMTLSCSLKKSKASSVNLIKQSTFEAKNGGAGEEWVDVFFGSLMYLHLNFFFTTTFCL